MGKYSNGLYKLAGMGEKEEIFLKADFILRAQTNISTRTKIFVKFPKMGLAENVNQNTTFSHYFLALVISMNLWHKGPGAPGV